MKTKLTFYMLLLVTVNIYAQEKANFHLANQTAITQMKVKNDSVSISNRPNTEISENNKGFIRVGMGSFGLGYDSETNSVLGKFTAMDFTLAFPQLGGLGFGTSVISVTGLRKTEMYSWFPVYSHFPIFISTKQNKEDIKSMLSIFAGGSYWCSKKEQGMLGGVDTVHADNYINVGINYIFHNYNLDDSLYGYGNFALEAGLISYQVNNSKRINSFYVGLILSIGAIARAS